MSRPVTFLLLLMSLSAIAAPDAVRESALRAHIRFLADDLLEGRGTGERGGELAAHYLATQLQALGLRGAGPNGAYRQPVSLVGVKASPQTTLAVRAESGKQEQLAWGDDFIAFTGAQKSDVSVDAEMVFVGYGIEAPAERWNDYKGKPEDFRGKVLVMLVNDPPATAAEPNLFGGKALTYYGRWTYKYEEAARRGAAGAILIHTDESAGYPWSVVRTSNGSWRYDPARAEGDHTPYLDARAWMTDAAATKIFKLAGKDLDALRRQAEKRDFQPVALGLRAVLPLHSEVRRVEAPNIVGILEGRAHPDEYVLLTAHWDHFGIGEPDKQGDRIYHGAVDNASGVAAVLEVARALSELPKSARPRRSVLFLFTTAEEQGLLGADWYAHHPLVPMAKTVADLNLDALNPLGPTRDMIALGSERSTISEWVKQVARAEGLRLRPERHPEQGSYFRSDHFPLAQAGIPAIDISTGDDYVGRPKGWGEKQFRLYNQTHYHQPSDKYDPAWDMRGMVQETRFTEELTRALADSDRRPRQLEGARTVTDPKTGS